MERLVSRYERADTHLTETIDQHTHLAVIAWLLGGLPEPEATQRLVAALRALDRRGLPPLVPARAYNESIALFWIATAARFVPRLADPAERLAAVRAFVRGFAPRPELVYDHFSPSLVHSWKARTAWVEPDLRPLDRLGTTRRTPRLTP